MIKKRRNAGFDYLGMQSDFNLVMGDAFGSSRTRRYGGKVGKRIKAQALLNKISAEEKKEQIRAGKKIKPQELLSKVSEEEWNQPTAYQQRQRGIMRQIARGKERRAARGVSPRVMAAREEIAAREAAAIENAKKTRGEIEKLKAAREARLKYGTPEQQVRELRNIAYEKQQKKQVKYIRQKLRYEGTRTGKAGMGISKFFGRVQTHRGFSKALLQRQGVLPEVTRVVDPLTKQQVREKGVKGYSYARAVPGARTGRVGRPYGSYAPQYAAVGGVYNFRKMIAHQRRLERLQAERNATLTPEQQTLLQQQAMQQQAARVNPEARVVPDTTGKINMAGYFQEINDAAGIVE